MVNITSRLGDLSNWSQGYITGSGSIDKTGANRYALNSNYAGVAGDRDLEFSVSYNFPQGTSEGSGAICVCERDGANNVVAYTESTSAVGEIPLPIHIRLNERTVYVEVAGRYLGSTYNGAVALLYDPPMIINADVNNGYPYNVLPEEVPTTKAMVQPYPDSWWRIQAGYNNGYPFNMLMPDIPTVDLAPPVKQRPYICLYRYDTPQNGFDNHGMFVLTPTKCTITEELNGRYEISMEHPIDPEGRWRYIRENAIIKAMGQLFTIRVVNQQWKGSSGKIVAKGDHIFYQCGDGIIHKGSTGITGTTVATICQQAAARIDNKDREGLLRYTFNGISNLVLSQEYILALTDFLDNSKTMVDFVMGNKGVIEASEGEIYRDNFNYSIYARKQGTYDNAFDIRIGKNMSGIKRTIDITTQCTYLDAYNNYGDGISYDITVSKMQTYGIPHHLVREKTYSYTINRPLSEEGLRQAAWIMLKMDAKRDINAMSAPLIAYEIDMHEVKNNPDYSEVVDSGGYTVGNGGILYDEHFGTVEIRVTKNTINAITDEVEQVTFGNVRSFIAQPESQLVIDVDPEIVDIWFQVQDSEGAFCYDSEGAMIIEHEGV